MLHCLPLGWFLIIIGWNQRSVKHGSKAHTTLSTGLIAEPDATQRGQERRRFRERRHSVLTLQDHQEKHLT